MPGQHAGGNAEVTLELLVAARREDGIDAAIGSDLTAQRRTLLASLLVQRQQAKQQLVKEVQYE